MSIYDRFFGPKKSAGDMDFSLPSHKTAKEFGKINIRQTDREFQIQLTILMEPQGQTAEGWQTGVALDCSASMKEAFGRRIKGNMPPKSIKEYEKKGWVEKRVDDGRKVKVFRQAAVDDAISKGYISLSANIVESVAREFIAYLAGNLDTDGGTTVIYWACGDGSNVEVLGDITEEQCPKTLIQGPQEVSFGSHTMLAPAMKYFVERFSQARRGMYIFITDGRIDDLEEVRQYTVQLAKQIQAGRRNFVKCVLVGVGEEIDEAQMEELDDLDTGTDIDIWDHKIAKEMRALIEIFAEVVSESQIVANTGTIYDSSGNVIKKYTDGLPAKITFNMPVTSSWFELEVAGQRIRQHAHDN